MVERDDAIGGRWAVNQREWTNSEFGFRAQNGLHCEIGNENSTERHCGCERSPCWKVNGSTGVLHPFFFEFREWDDARGRSLALTVTSGERNGSGTQRESDAVFAVFACSYGSGSFVMGTRRCALHAGTNDFCGGGPAVQQTTGRMHNTAGIFPALQ